MANELKPWVVRDVSEETRRKVKLYAVQHGLTMAQALEQLVDIALGKAAQSTLTIPLGNPEQAQQILGVLQQMIQSSAVGEVASRVDEE